ncbi:MAG: glycosyltransferase family 8 protein [Oscillospiraceae bacterium]|nr:glycosyltransferase family 8 protein [Oscillospiraceae bacterium]
MDNTIKPAFDLNNVAVCLACSNAYSVFACVTINSLIQNSSADNNYDIIVMNTDISENNMDKIQSISDGYDNVSIRFFNVSEFIGNKTFYTWGPFTKFTYYRLLVPDIFEQYRKIIYLDSDIIVNHDIAELFNTDVNGWLMAAARDTHVMGRLCSPEINDVSHFIEDVGVDDGISYYQCGVLVYNIDECRKAFPRGYLLQEGSTRQLKWLDQDLINILAKGKIYTLENKWNVMIKNNPIIDEDYLIEPYKSNYYTARENPYIVHYIGQSMPCYKPAADFYELYWKYARTTPYYELMISMMIDVKIGRFKQSLVEEYQLAGKVEKSSSPKKKFKEKVIMPVVNLFFPKGSKRRQSLKRAYFKMRGWECE